MASKNRKTGRNFKSLDSYVSRNGKSRLLIRLFFVY